MNKNECARKTCYIKFRALITVRALVAKGRGMLARNSPQYEQCGIRQSDEFHVQSCCEIYKVGTSFRGGLGKMLKRYVNCDVWAMRKAFEIALIENR